MRTNISGLTHIALIEVGIQQLAIRRVDDGRAVGGGKDVCGAAGMQMPQCDWLGAQRELLSLTERPCSWVDMPVACSRL